MSDVKKPAEQDKDKLISELKYKVGILETRLSSLEKEFNIKDEVTRDGVVTEVLLRVSSLEKILINKNVMTAKEFGAIFEASIKKVQDLMKEQQDKLNSENTTIFVPGKLKN